MPGFDYGKYMASREGRSAMKDLGSGMGLTSEGDMPSEGTAALKAAGSVVSMVNPVIGFGVRAGHAVKRAGEIPGMISGLAREFDYSPEEKKARASLGLTPSDSRVESLKGLSQDPNGYKNAKEFAGELAMSGGGKALGGIMGAFKKSPKLALDAPERAAGKAREVIESLKAGTPQEQAEKASLLTDLMKKGAYEKYNIADADLGYVKGATKPLIGDAPEILRKTKSYINSGGLDPTSVIKSSPSQIEKEILSDISLTGKKAVGGGGDLGILERMINQFLQTGQLDKFKIKSAGGRSNL